MKLSQLLIAGTAAFSISAFAAGYGQQESTQGQTGNGPAVQAPDNGGGLTKEQPSVNGSAGASSSEGASSTQGASSSEGASSSMQNNPQIVREVQQKLKDQGMYQGQVDGNWSPDVQTAVKQFQQKQNLQANGELDEQTLAAMDIQPQSTTGQSGMQQQEGTTQERSESPAQEQQENNSK